MMKHFVCLIRPIEKYRVRFCLLFSLFYAFVFFSQPIVAQTGGPAIGSTITTNLADYTNGQVPRYEKFELTFDITTVAQNLQWPYDPSPPPGIQPGLGITVDALFTPDNWQTVYTQPAFYYQEFQHQLKNDADWIYPTGNYAWKVRFTPNQVGDWQFKIRATDATGTTETSSQTFKVISSNNKGFARVSATDSRYFEYDNGTYFPGLSYNSAYREIDPINPTGFKTQDTIQHLGDNNIQLIRMWLSTWAVFGSTWNPWKSNNPVHNTQEPDARLQHETAAPFDMAPGSLAVPGSEVFLWLSHNETVYGDGNQWSFAPCMVMGWESASVPLKRNTDYRVRVRYRDMGITGPRVAGKPYGFVVKTGGWLWDDTDETKSCYYPGTGTLLAATYSTTPQWRNYPDPDHSGWRILEGDFNSGGSDFIDKLYLAIENAASSTGATGVIVDYIWIEENLGGGQYGPNVIYKPWMAHHQYFDQRHSYALDKVLELAKQRDIYFKLVIHEKQDYVLNIFEFDGSLSPYLPYENPVRLFYGNGRETSGKTKIRWLEETWWRYLQARWGYSTNIHSWELLNEGDPASISHYILTDELGKYMHQFAPNDHLVTTSFWHSFPSYAFWGNADYSDVDYADVHQYVYQDDGPTFDNTALNTQTLSLEYGAYQPEGPGKPVMRGEVGWIFNGDDLFAQNASNGLWLHNFVWGGINAGGLIESYWGGHPTQRHIYNSASHDHRPIFKTYYNFVADIPLNNGHYQDAQAVPSQPDLQAWGQKDVDHGCAHLWIQNKKHTWKNVFDNVSVPGISGTVTMSGFQPNQNYIVEWWDPYQANKTEQIILTEDIAAQSDGSISISVNNLTTDVALKLITPGHCKPANNFYGFTLSATPSVQAVEVGGVATYTLQVQRTGSFADPITVQASPSPSLTIVLKPTTIISPATETTLIVTDTHDSSLVSGLRYTIPIIAIGNGITEMTNVILLVGGSQVFLPLMLKAA